jgi:putative flavoprotein involved in K+ transport
VISVVIVGAGPAGLAAAAALQSRRFAPVVLEGESHVGGPWRRHYEGIRLQSPKSMSWLPGMRFDDKVDRWVTQAQFIEYLEQYTQFHHIDIKFGTQVSTIRRVEQEWVIDTTAGRFNSRVVVVCMGYNRVPFIPDFPGMDRFTGEIYHSSIITRPSDYCGADVLVVGTGNSGAEIAAKIAAAGAKRVRISVRTYPHVVKRSFLGVPTIVGAVLVDPLPPKVGDWLLGPTNRLMVGDLRRLGLRNPAEGMVSTYAKRKVTPIIDTGFLAELREGRIEPVAGVRSFDEHEVMLCDNSKVPTDVVILATGYRRGLDSVFPKGEVLNGSGDPLADGPEPLANAPGLYFFGYTHPFSGNLRRLRIEAPKLAEEVRRYCCEQDARNFSRTD